MEEGDDDDTAPRPLNSAECEKIELGLRDRGFIRRLSCVFSQLGYVPFTN
jgi:hypothetical protein